MKRTTRIGKTGTSVTIRKSMGTGRTITETTFRNSKTGKERKRITETIKLPSGTRSKRLY